MNNLKLLLFLFLTIGNLSIASQDCRDRILESLIKTDTQVTTQLLGYDPHISIYKTDSCQNSDEITVYAHGLGENQRAIEYLQRNTLLLPGTVVGFNFPDASNGANPFDAFGKASSLCQEKDIAPLLLTLKHIDMSGVKKIHLFGHSRGGGTIIRMLYLLQSYKKHISFFKSIGFSPEDATNIFQKIHSGSIVISNPLIDINHALKKTMGALDVAWVTPLIKTFVLPAISSFNPLKKEVIKCAQYLRVYEFPILFYFDSNDPCNTEKTITKLCKTINGNHIYFSFGSSGPLLIQPHQALEKSLNEFRKQYGGSYYASTLTEP